MRFAVSINSAELFPVITLTDGQSATSAEIYAKGGLLNKFLFTGNGQSYNVVDGFDSPAQMQTDITNGFKSAKLSPFVCRLRNGEYSHQHTTYKIQKWYLSKHAIHGLLYDADFVVTDSFASSEKAAVTLEYHYEGSDPGYPFPFTMMVSWQLTAGSQLSVVTSVYHHNKEAIPMADGWHPYFTLGTSVDECTLQFDSSVQLEYDAELLPTGKTFTDKRFREGCLLKEIQLDNSFALDTDLVQPRCVLKNKDLQLTIEPGKTYPILQVYIPPHRNSIAIENLSGAPDNFNNGMGLIMLAPNEQKVFRTSYRISNAE